MDLVEFSQLGVKNLKVLSSRWLRSLISVAIALSLFLSFPRTTLADGFQGEPDLEQAAILMSPQSDRPIPIALRPAPNQPSVGYGISGHPVTVLEQVGDYLDFDDPNATWCHIRLDEKPYTEGWIKGSFLSILGPKA